MLGLIEQIIINFTPAFSQFLRGLSIDIFLLSGTINSIGFNSKIIFSGMIK